MRIKGAKKELQKSYSLFDNISFLPFITTHFKAIFCGE